MDDSTKKVISVTVPFFIIASILKISEWLHNTFSIPYLSFFVLLIFTMFLGMGLHLYLLKYDWYKELINREYREFKMLFDSYRAEVLKEEKHYDIFKAEYLAKNQYISIPIDSKGNPQIEELNKKCLLYFRIQNLLLTRQDLVERYFQNGNFGYNDFLALKDEYEKTVPPQTKVSPSKTENENSVNEANTKPLLPVAAKYSIENKQVALKVKEFVLTCYKDEGVMSHGDRLFGYYLNHRHPELKTAEQYIDAWNTYIGENVPRDSCKYLKTPSHWNFKKNEEKATLKTLKKIEIFYLELMQDDSVILKTLQKDITELEEIIKNKS